MTQLALEILLSLLLVMGGLFGLVGSYGLIRLRDTMQALHAPTKATTLGVGTALIASDVEFFLLNGRPAWEEIFVAVFLFLTAPVSAYMIAQVVRQQKGRPD